MSKTICLIRFWCPTVLHKWNRSVEEIDNSTYYYSSKNSSAATWSGWFLALCCDVRYSDHESFKHQIGILCKIQFLCLTGNCWNAQTYWRVQIQHFLQQTLFIDKVTINLSVMTMSALKLAHVRLCTMLVAWQWCKGTHFSTDKAAAS